MYFDWITWGIWLSGFVILVMWIWIPYREFKELLAKKSMSRAGDPSLPKV